MNKKNIPFPLIFQNWQLKLLALALGTLTYYAIQGATGYEVEYHVPLEVIVNEPGIAILNQDPTSVKVRFRGAQDDLLRLDQKRIKAVVHPKVGTLLHAREEVAITMRDIQGRSGVQVVQIEPPVVQLTFDREVETTVRVLEPRTIGTPLVGTVQIEYAPKTVTIRGPKRRLEQMKREGKDVVSTEPIDVDGRVESFTKQVRILSPSDAWVSRIDPSEITVNVNIVTQTTRREWPHIPIRAIMTPDAGLRISLDPGFVDVALEGRVDILKNLDDKSLRVFVDCTDIREAGSYSLPAIIHLSNQLKVKSTLTPNTVTVTVGSTQSSEPRVENGKNSKL
jgi:hypothetical protein